MTDSTPKGHIPESNCNSTERDLISENCGKGKFEREGRLFLVGNHGGDLSC